MKGKCDSHSLYCPHEEETELLIQLTNPVNPVRAPKFCSLKCADDYLHEISEGTWGLEPEIRRRGVLNLKTGKLVTEMPAGTYKYITRDGDVIDLPETGD